MADLAKQVFAERENVEIALSNLRTAMAREDRSVIELSAIATFLHNIYNGIENILKHVLSSGNIEVRRSDIWHKDLLSLSKSSGILPAELCGKLYEYLTFRHFFVHAYSFMLDEAHLEDLTNDIPEIWRQFLLEIEKYYTA